jgi:hypothetical protein
MFEERYQVGIKVKLTKIYMPQVKLTQIYMPQVKLTQILYAAGEFNTDLYRR